MRAAEQLLLDRRLSLKERRPVGCDRILLS
jgi:hypothetical protein